MLHRNTVFLLIFISTFFNLANAQQLFSIHGSNTIGAELAPALVKSYLQTQHKLQNVQYIQTAPEEGIVRGFNAVANQSFEVEIYAHGSSTGFKSLDASKADIAMSSRIIKAKEINKLASLGDMKSFRSENVIGLDGIAVIIHRDNPIKSLPRKVLTDIFSGKIKYWHQVSSTLVNTGFNKKRIQLYARDNKSGTYDTFKKLVLVNKTKLDKRAKRFESNARLSAEVSVTPYAIGFVGLPYIRASKAIAVSEGDGKARKPNSLTVATEDYALSRRLYMYISEDSSNKDVNQFIEFVQGQSGQKIVDDTGFVSQNIYAAEVKIPPFYPQEYKQFTEFAKRLSVNIHFKQGSLKPDNRAIRDLKRVADFIKQNAHIKEVMLFGFSEDNDFAMFNISLSEIRADFIERLLKRHGVVVNKIRGYGAINPVAMNSQIEKNRRIEIWVK